MSFQEGSSRVTTAVPAATPPAEPREWRTVPPRTDMQWKNIWAKVTDADSYWSIATASVVGLILASIILLYTRPVLVLQKDEEGNIYGPGGETKISFVKVLVSALVVAGIIGGAGVFVKSRRQRGL